MVAGAGQAVASAAELDAGTFSAVVDEVMETVFEKGLDQDDEIDADLIGTRYAYLLGYEPRGLRAFVATLGKLNGYESSVLFKTHPDPRTRLEALDEELPKYRDRYGAPDLASRLAEQKRKAGIRSRTAALPHTFCATHPEHRASRDS